MSTVIKMECDDCSKGKYVEKETISHIREKVGLSKYFDRFPAYVQGLQPAEKRKPNKK